MNVNPNMTLGWMSGIAWVQPLDFALDSLPADFAFVNCLGSVTVKWHNLFTHFPSYSG